MKETVCSVQQPLVGEIIVEKSDRPIRSIELQLVRVEIVTGETKALLFLCYYCFHIIELYISIHF